LANNEQLSQCLKEIIRVVKLGGLLIAVEQIRRKRRFKQKEMRLQRPAEESLQLLESFLGKLLKKPLLDYASIVFVAVKPLLKG
jgi:hypothetical protein